MYNPIVVAALAPHASLVHSKHYAHILSEHYFDVTTSKDQLQRHQITIYFFMKF